MNQHLLTAAAKVIPDSAVLVNVVSLRVRQLAQGAKALMELAPGMSLADAALSEIIGKKLTFELTPGKNGERRAAATYRSFQHGVRRQKKSRASLVTLMKPDDRAHTIPPAWPGRSFNATRDSRRRGRVSSACHHGSRPSRHRACAGGSTEWRYHPDNGR